MRTLAQCNAAGTTKLKLVPGEQAASHRWRCRRGRCPSGRLPEAAEKASRCNMAGCVCSSSAIRGRSNAVCWCCTRQARSSQIRGSQTQMHANKRQVRPHLDHERADDAVELHGRGKKTVARGSAAAPAGLSGGENRQTDASNSTGWAAAAGRVRKGRQPATRDQLAGEKASCICPV